MHLLRVNQSIDLPSITKQFLFMNESRNFLNEIDGLFKTKVRDE